VKHEDHDVVLGYAGAEVRKTMKADPADAPPWDLTTQFAHVGGDTDRLDAVAKVTGRAKYTFDMNLPGMLHGVLLRASVPHARVQSLSLDAARARKGVRAVVSLKPDGQRVRFVGDAIAAVAADSRDAALDALGALQPNYAAEAGNAIDLRDAEGAPTLDANGRVTDAWPEKDREAIDEAITQCKHLVEETFAVEVQTHSSLESHGAVARWNDDGSLDVWCSTQATFGVRQGIAEAVELPVDRVRVHAEFVGGGFGSKFSPGSEALAAVLLARESKRPVKVMLDRYEEHTCAGNRPSAIMRVRAGIDEAGHVRAWDWQSFGGPGFTKSGGRVAYVRSYFDRAKVRHAHTDLLTFTDAARSMRAPGWPQGAFAAEAMLDMLAEKAGMDALAFRLHNDSDALRQHEWKLGAERFGWESRRNPKPGQPRDPAKPRILTGAGLAAAAWGQMGSTRNGVLCRIWADGTVEARNGAQDIGTGMKTLLAMLVAEELGLAPSAIKVTMGHTDDPVGPGSGGSTTTPSLAPTARHAAFLAKAELVQRVAESLGIEPGEVRYENGKVIAKERTLEFTEACRAIGPQPIETVGKRFANVEGYRDTVAGCQFAEVAVDTHTGLVRVTRMLAVQDCGLVLNRKLAESQVLGAMIQGISYALHEQRLMDRPSGRMVNGDFSSYKIAGIRDVPELTAILFSVANGKNNVGAAGLGEPPSVASPAAVANAVANAIGVRIPSLPITPDKVLAALARAKRSDSKTEGKTGR
jgi:xanthine dehydrogenase YagR molybdenum-binding subunit